MRRAPRTFIRSPIHKEVLMAESNTLTFKGRPLMRKDNLIYYGSMADSHIILLQIMLLAPL